MVDNGIPGVEVLGPGEENLRFVIGLIVYAGALIGMIIYLIYKLPRDGSGSSEDNVVENQERQSSSHDDRGE